MHALSQLSYGPVGLRQCSPELEIRRPVHPDGLVVPRRLQAQLNSCPMDRHLKRKQVAPIGELGVGSHGIDLPGLVLAVDETGASSARTPCSDDQNVAPSPGPFALNAQERGPEIEDEVVAFVAERLRNPHSLTQAPRQRPLSQQRCLSDQSSAPTTTVAPNRTLVCCLFRPWPLRPSRAGRRPRVLRAGSTGAPRV